MSQVNSYGHGGMVSSPNHTFLGKLEQAGAHTFPCNWQQPFFNDSAEGGSMTVEIISWSISTKVWNRARIKLVTPGSAVRCASVARHVTDCATQPGTFRAWNLALRLVLDITKKLGMSNPLVHRQGSFCLFHLFDYSLSTEFYWKIMLTICSPNI